jgi:hypothetical protein
MQLDELRVISRALPIGAPDQKRDVATLSAALASYSARVSAALGRTGTNTDAELARNCGALLLMLVAISDGHGLVLADVVRAGERELRPD